MQSSDCLRRYWLSTAYLMLGGPDNTRLNHAVKVLAVNCIFDVRWTCHSGYFLGIIRYGPMGPCH